MRRRDVLRLLGGAAVLWPSHSTAQTLQKVWRVTHVLPASSSVMGGLAHVFEQRLIELGYVPSRNVILTHRFVEPKELEHTLLGLLPSTDLLVIWTTLGAVTAKKVASELPIVFLGVGAPLDLGLVQSLAHPGGNMTGVTFQAASETYAKRLQILTEIVPNLSRVAVLRTIGDANVAFALKSLEQAAPQLGVTLLPFDIRTADELPDAFDAMTADNAQALIAISSAVVYGATKRVAELALLHRLPSCHPFRETVAAGGLVSLGPDASVMAKQGADYAARIMQGSKPSDVPVEQPTRYEMHINLKTANALGITVPATLLARADEVIE
jgi:putative ABC transport system substrate-binding protein